MRYIPNFRLFMLTVFLVLITLFSSVVTVASSGVVSNMLTRVFRVRIGNLSGTAFTIEVDERQYLVTAKHIIQNVPTPNVIEIFYKNSWVKIPFRLISVEPSSVDIVILALDQQISPLLPIEIGLDDSYLSQEVYFVGFPYGLFMNGRNAEQGFPFPLVKHGIIAKFPDNKGDFILIDAINNNGFSGGPVVTCSNTFKNTIIGVVSGYKVQQEAVYNQGIKIDSVNVNSNTGLMIVYPIENAIEAIKKNPIGYCVQVKKSK